MKVLSRGLGYTESAISIWEPNVAVGVWTPTEAKWSHTWLTSL